MTDKAVNNVKAWLTPILITVIGFLSIYTLNGVNNRLDKLEVKVDELMAYKVILQRLADRNIAYSFPSLPPFKHEDFITLKIETDEGVF